MPMLPTDTYFANQWYLLNTGQSGGLAGIDLNVVGVWADYTGRGVRVGVFDTGIDYRHPDLNDNVMRANDPGNSNTRPFDPHGTMVGGIIAAERNGAGVVGVAYEATLISSYADHSLYPTLGE